MEYRKLGRLAAHKYLGNETLLTPQLEDYDVYRSGICDPYVPIGPFKLVLNMACFGPAEIDLTFPEEKILQVCGLHAARKFEGLVLARDCTIKFVLPDEVDKNKLKATWYNDQFLVISLEEETADELSPEAETVSGTEETTRLAMRTTDPESGDPNPGSRGLEDVAKLKHVSVKRNFKPLVDVDELQNLFAEIADKASMDEKYVLNFFFSTPNIARERRKVFNSSETKNLLLYLHDRPSPLQLPIGGTE